MEIPNVRAIRMVLAKNLGPIENALPHISNPQAQKKCVEAFENLVLLNDVLRIKTKNNGD